MFQHESKGQIFELNKTLNKDLTKNLFRYSNYIQLILFFI